MYCSRLERILIERGKLPLLDKGVFRNIENVKIFYSEALFTNQTLNSQTGD